MDSIPGGGTHRARTGAPSSALGSALATEGLDPPWRLHGAPPEQVEKALEEGWIRPGLRTLVVGCGVGDEAAWLARAGFRVHGVDNSTIAIREARRVYQGVEDLTFQIHDVCVDRPDLPGYDFLFDRGCLHTLTARLQTAYVSYLAAAAHPGARYLLIHALRPPPGVTRAEGREHLVEHLSQLFAATFALEQVESITMMTRLPRPVPGLALRLHHV